jgi:heterodisulfide reductase subunit A-like polyferredoxin
MAAKVDTGKCTGCMLCVDACSFDAVEIINGVAVVDEVACVECGACVEQCPNEAISLE